MMRNLFRRRKAPRTTDAIPSHIGIELRISIPAGVILQADSDLLHWSAMLRGGETEWTELLTTVDGMRIETRAVKFLD